MDTAQFVCTIIFILAAFISGLYFGYKVAMKEKAKASFKVGDVVRGKNVMMRFESQEDAARLKNSSSPFNGMIGVIDEIDEDDAVRKYHIPMWGNMWFMESELELVVPEENKEG